MQRIILSVAVAALFAIPSPAHSAIILDFVPDVGDVSILGDTKIVEVFPATVIHFTITASSTESEVLGAFQLNFENSSIGPGQLVLNNWTLGPSWGSLDNGVLNSAGGDNFVAGGVFSGGLSTPRQLGTFQATVPSTLGQFALTVDRVGVNSNNDTLFGDALFSPLAIEQFGNVTINAVPEPSVLALMTVAAFLLPTTWLARRRRLCPANETAQ